MSAYEMGIEPEKQEFSDTTNGEYEHGKSADAPGMVSHTFV